MSHPDVVHAVIAMQEYIEENLSSPITLHALAQVAGYSPCYSDRIFRELTGKTPFDYIRALRLSKAALVLRDGKVKVTDVAFDFLFDSHEGFTKAFSRQFGLPPKKYSKETPAISLWVPYRVRDPKGRAKKEKSMGVNENTVFVQVIERPARKVLIKRGIAAKGYFEYCEEVGCDVWGVLLSVKEALYEPIGMWLPPKMIPEGTSEYVQGVELPLDYNKAIPDGYELTSFPACKMMIFQGPPFEDADFEEAISDIWDKMKTYDPTLYGFEWADEDAPRFQLEPRGYRGYMEARCVREIQ